MCIDEHNRLLEKRLFNCQAIDQSRRRHRLPGILVFSENAMLTIPERYNHVDRFRCIYYGNQDEYDKEKTEKLLNSK